MFLHAYLKGVKSYNKLNMDPKGSKFIISMNFTYEKTHMRMNYKDVEVKEL